MPGINAISRASCPKVNFKQNFENGNKSFTKADVPSDYFNYSKDVNVAMPKISKTRLFFDRLTDEQIALVNKTRKLPEGAKFCMNGFGGYGICNNFFGLRAGTQTLPAGFELKKNILGFTVVVPKDTKGAFIKG